MEENELNEEGFTEYQKLKDELIQTQTRLDDFATKHNIELEDPVIINEDRPVVPKEESISTGDKDEFGILKIKPDASSGKFLKNFKLDKKIRHYRSGKPDEPSVEYTNAAGSADEGSDGIVNQEVTYYVRINGFKPDDDTISTKILGGSHSSSHPKTGTCYDCEVNVNGGNGNTLQVERPHPTMWDNDQNTQFKIGERLVGKYIGIKMISYLINNNKDRHLEMWIDFPVPDIGNPLNLWRKYYEVDDTNQLQKGHIIKPIGSLTTVRIDGVWKGPVHSNPKISDVSPPDFKYASVREIGVI